MTTKPPLLELDHVAKQYDATITSGPVQVLRDVTLSVERGNTISIVGPSGSGKSTLLNIIGTLDHPTTGRVLLDGRDLAECSDAESAAIRNQHIGFVFQSHHLLPQCTARENVLIPTLAQRDPTRHRTAEARADQLLEQVGLADRTSHRPAELSTGQCQRVAVARALINDPALLLADEPTGALDASTSDTLIELLVELNRASAVTLLVATHARKLADQMERQYELRDGALVGLGPRQ